MQRLQHSLILKDLSRKMVFLTGPRQVGKTSLALAIAEEYEHAVYLNYDNLTTVKSSVKQPGYLKPAY
ncbi:MAG: AAA family ATPase [Methylococcales bacterium]